MAGSRADDAQFAERVNAAADVIAGGVTAVEAAAMLAARFGVSTRLGASVPGPGVLSRSA
jgi:hypothetical protein